MYDFYSKDLLLYTYKESLFFTINDPSTPQIIKDILLKEYNIILRSTNIHSTTQIGLNLGLRVKTVVDHILQSSPVESPIKQVISTNIHSTTQIGFNHRLLGKTVVHHIIKSF